MVEMTYNSTRNDLAIPEYGRTIQEMVDHLKSLADKDERNKCANAIVSIMGSVVPQEGDKEEVQKKLWGQLLAKRLPERAELSPPLASTIRMRNRDWGIMGN